jgi:hypothetical protein
MQIIIIISFEIKKNKPKRIIIIKLVLKLKEINLKE